jgi:hypothetical protein
VEELTTGTNTWATTVGTTWSGASRARLAR